MISALLLGATILGGIGTITIASKSVDNEPKTVNHINNNTVINNNQKFIHNNQKTTKNTTNVKNSMNQSMEKANDNKALEEKITAELNRIEDEIIEEMLQQFYMNNLENDISGKIKGGK
jgi:methylthioribose-1-phosphate isomerase